MEVELTQDFNVGYVPFTPAQPIQGRELVSVAYDGLVAHASRTGTVVGYKQEQNGEHIQHVLPNMKTEYGQISTSSKTELHLHTELAFHPYRPEFVYLLCLRGDPTAYTTYARLSRIMDEIETYEEDLLETLQLPLYETSLDESFRTNGEEDSKFTLPILRKNNANEWELTYDYSLMTGLTFEAQQALDTLNNIVIRCTEEVALESGDLLTIDNTQAVHGRRPFQPRYDGTDRWVLRCLTKRPIPAVGQFDHANSVITTTFNNKST